jgi:hypothetical protein
VNEAAAQLCLKKPILLMRRDELFPLARQVVRDSGYQYSKGHSRSQFQAGYPSKVFGLGGNSNSGNEENSRDSSNGDGQKSIKRARYSESEDGIKKVRPPKYMLKTRSTFLINNLLSKSTASLKGVFARN